MSDKEEFGNTMLGAGLGCAAVIFAITLAMFVTGYVARKSYSDKPPTEAKP